MLKSVIHEEIVGAVARGWCHKTNENKTMDSDLAYAIVEEIEALLKVNEEVPK